MTLSQTLNLNPKSLNHNPQPSTLNTDYHMYINLTWIRWKMTLIVNKNPGNAAGGLRATLSDLGIYGQWLLDGYSVPQGFLLRDL